MYVIAYSNSPIPFLYARVLCLSNSSQLQKWKTITLVWYTSSYIKIASQPGMSTHSEISFTSITYELRMHLKHSPIAKQGMTSKLSNSSGDILQKQPRKLKMFYDCPYLHKFQEADQLLVFLPLFLSSLILVPTFPSSLNLVPLFLPFLLFIYLFLS